jgi:cytochrome c556
MKLGLIPILLIVGSMAALPIAAETPADPVTGRLSPETRILIVQEMQAVDTAMGHIRTALVTGDHEAIAREARAIYDSFVLDRELTDAQRAEIHALPSAFVAADQAFHRLAARLHAAAQAHDVQLERVWFEEMNRACLSCHAEHAAARFPGLVEVTTAAEPHAH